MNHFHQLGFILALGCLTGFLSCGLSRPTGDIHQFESYFARDSDPFATCGVSVTFLGASTLLFDDGETRILVDAYLSRLPLRHLVLNRVQTDTVLANRFISSLNEKHLDAIFITHSHFDHALDVGYIARETGASVFGSESTRNICLGNHVPTEQIHIVEDGSRVKLGQFDILCISAVHSPMKRIIDDLGRGIDRPLGQPSHIVRYHEGGSFQLLVKHQGHNLYINPSANELDQVPDSIRAEVVFLGMGLMKHENDSFRKAYYAHSVSKLEARLVIPIHWDNYCLPAEPELDLIPASVSNTTLWFDQTIASIQLEGGDFQILPVGHAVRLFCDEP